MFCHFIISFYFCFSFLLFILPLYYFLFNFYLPVPTIFSQSSFFSSYFLPLIIFFKSPFLLSFPYFPPTIYHFSLLISSSNLSIPFIISFICYSGPSLSFFSLWYLPRFLSSFLLSFVDSKRAIILSSISHTFSHLYSKTNPLLLLSSILSPPPWLFPSQKKDSCVDMQL